MITLTREEAQQVLDALELVTDLTNHDDEIYDAIEALRAALAQPEQAVARKFPREPEQAGGWTIDYSLIRNIRGIAENSGDDFCPGYEEIECVLMALEEIYTAPPQREFIGLTDMEIVGIATLNQGSDFSFARAIEAKLKEKNDLATTKS